MLIPTIKHKNINIGDRVLLRSSLNVPIEDGKITSGFRLKESIRTIKYLSDRGVRLTIISHRSDSTASLAVVHKELNKIIPVSFINALSGENVLSARENLKNGEILLLENTRFDIRETREDQFLIKELSNGTDYFVFDDFSAAHREHSSTTGLIKNLPSYAGIRFEEELNAIKNIKDKISSPSVAILGGAKCSTKIPLIKELVKIYDIVFIGGVIANTLLKKKGCNIGLSKFEDVEISDEVLNNKKILLPKDVIVEDENSNSRLINLLDIKDNDVIVDVGDASLRLLNYHIEEAKTVLWNGPLGFYEKGYTKQSLMLSELITKQSAYTLVGGGDTISVLENANKLKDWKFVSTGGGSLFELLSNRTLPVIEAFNSKINN